MSSAIGKRVWIAGDRGMLGSALVRRMAGEGSQLISAERAELDFRRQAEVEAFLQRQRPDVVVVAAGTVGGIAANAAYPADFLQDNLLIAANIIGAAHAADVQRLLYVSSSCSYPKCAAQPIVEDALLSGPLEPTNEAYATAKIAGVQLTRAYHTQHGRDYFVAVPTNLYGPGDRFDLERGHVLAALMRKAHEAKRFGRSEIAVWGSGMPLREFLHVDDCADALIHLLMHYRGGGEFNVGSGEEISILELAQTICEVVGFRGHITHDRSKPDGTRRKLLDCSRLQALGWEPRISFREGVQQTYRWYLDHMVEEPA